jgi:hypothetical protein
MNCTQIAVGTDITNFNEIETRCVNQHHLFEGEKLKEIIKKDEDKLASYGITFDQLNKLFDNIRQTTSHDNWRMEELTTQEDRDKMCQYIPICREQSDQHKNQTKYPLFDGKFYVIKAEWLGSERCPFQPDSDTKYYGLDYGCRDFLIINKDGSDCIHIGDLLFHQIIVHHFFQSPSSQYHVDIDRLVKFFDLQPNVDYSFKKPVEYGDLGINSVIQLNMMSILSGMSGIRYSS